uniref:ATP synthase F0 subunit 8 n=1 Tax=Trichogramma cacaeciae TaxID=1667566 RepID=UPI0022A7A104|nr:ATP synthase F0 subunit 8 [Trichogramma cacaeciae]UZS90466.1 ATP synthase F0 subunit 8 [Trichogramma cacaeciae]
MPQMSPMLWLFTYLYFLLLMGLSVLLIYYLLSFSFKNLISDKLNFMMNYNFKFLW